MNIPRRVTDQDPNVPRPRDIRTDSTVPFINAFNGDTRAGYVAFAIVLLCRDLNGWHGLTLGQIRQKYDTFGRSLPFSIVGVEGLLIFGGGKYYVTQIFVEKCVEYTASIQPEPQPA